MILGHGGEEFWELEIEEVGIHKKLGVREKREFDNL